ncbi:hypothetical protein [Actinoallomurus iriomotensis]|uniref:Uncharacterized protein n=1 Tax=Actinoallomurus iriomotensis TaxID=478107 RepID=A0A9W6RPJ0_9ACTN|nr:hypothetical protein [Actinoallomurus iriomotensis]GLY79428.1 hypothetical protein Airi01_076950 [Actinoallomurus iriomotensis]
MTRRYPRRRLRRSADIVFTATVRAEELRFHAVPDTSVEFTGDADAESTSGSVRTNLPDQVAESVVYRDVRIDYAIAAKLRREDRAGDSRPALGQQLQSTEALPPFEK